jgi:hypothetical protein
MLRREHIRHLGRLIHILYGDNIPNGIVVLQRLYDPFRIRYKYREAHKVLGLLLALETRGFARSLPGKFYVKSERL